MIIGFDLDETITAHPEKFRELIGDLYTRHHIIILTGRSEQQGRQVTELYLRQYHIPYHQLIMCPDDYDFTRQAYTPEFMQRLAEWKAEVCREEEMDLMYDDMEIFCQVIKQQNPTMMVMRVL